MTTGDREWLDEAKDLATLSTWSEALPWFFPAMMLSVFVSVFVSRPFARLFILSQPVAFGVLCALGLTLSATLTPLGDMAVEIGRSGACDTSRVGLPPLGQLRGVNDTSLNVLLFMPLGFSIGLIPSRGPKTMLIVAAMALPASIEVVQLLVPSLGRGCQTADVIDNVAGLLLGFGAGVVTMCMGGRRGPVGR